jgi:hypothetical protein
MDLQMRSRQQRLRKTSLSNRSKQSRMENKLSLAEFYGLAVSVYHSQTILNHVHTIEHFESLISG